MDRAAAGVAINGVATRERAAARGFLRRERRIMAATTRSGRTVTGLFRDRESADRAYQAAIDRGYTRDDLNVAMSKETRETYGDLEPGNKAMEGAGTGGAIGSVAGGLIGAVAAIGTTLVLPGLGLWIAGPLAAGLAGAGAGGLTGGLIGALVGWGIPEEDAKEYERGIREGGTVIGVSPRGDEDATALETAWRGHGASRVDRY
jgi:hypothetical protein